MGWIPVCTGMTKVPGMRKNDPTFLVKLYNFGFSVVIVAKRNHDDEKGDHIHGGDHRLDRAEKLGGKNNHQHIIQIAQHNRAGQLILYCTFPEEEYSNNTYRWPQAQRPQ